MIRKVKSKKQNHLIHCGKSQKQQRKRKNSLKKYLKLEIQM